MDLTIKQIKEKQRDLEVAIEDALNKFYKETGIAVSGKIRLGYDNGEYSQLVTLEYKNPFN